MRFTSILFAVIAILVGCQTVQQTPGPAAPDLRAARAALVAGQLGAAETSLRRAKIACPSERAVEDFNLKGGKLLGFSPELNLSDCAAYEASNGFFDPWNVPPWDTWVYFLDESNLFKLDTNIHTALKDVVTSNFFRGPTLISWVPSGLTSLVDRGINATPEMCIGWIEDLDTFKDRLAI